jgi:hypothetical protein
MPSRRSFLSQLAFGIVGLSTPSAADAACRFFRRRNRSHRWFRSPTRARSAEQKRAPLDESGLYGYVRRDGSMIQPQFLEASRFSDGVAAVFPRGAFRSAILDESGTLNTRSEARVIYEFSEGLGAAVDDSLGIGYVDRHGRFVIAPRQDLMMAHEFHDGLAEVTIPHGPEKEYRSKHGFIDTTGRQVIPFEFDNAREFSEGFAEVEVNDRWNFIDKSGRLLLKEWVDGTAFGFSDGLAAVQKGDLWGYVDTHGELVIPARFGYITPFNSGRAMVYLDNKIGSKGRMINKAGRFVGDRIFSSSLNHFREGVVFVDDDDVQGLECLDVDGKTVISPEKLAGLSWRGNFEQGLAAVRSKATGKHGYINRSGDVVIRPQFVQAEDFSSNLARFSTRKNMIWHEIDRSLDGSS